MLKNCSVRLQKVSGNWKTIIKVWPTYCERCEKNQEDTCVIWCFGVLTGPEREIYCSYGTLLHTQLS